MELITLVYMTGLLLGSGVGIVDVPKHQINAKHSIYIISEILQFSEVRFQVSQWSELKCGCTNREGCNAWNNHTFLFSGCFSPSNNCKWKDVAFSGWETVFTTDRPHLAQIPPFARNRLVLGSATSPKLISFRLISHWYFTLFAALK